MNPLTTPWLEATIIGFAYLVLAAVFFFLLLGQPVFVITSELIDIIPYISIIILFSSYITGLSIHLITQDIIAKYLKKRTTPLSKILEFKENFPKKYITLQNNFAILIMYRHLSLAFFGLTILTTILIHSKYNKFHITIAVFFLLSMFTLLFWLANKSQSKIVNDIKKEKGNEKIPSD